ncbi:MAG: OmpA family protein, partial [Kineosporiaceae bacterium]
PAAPVQTRVVAVADQGRVLLAGALPDTATAQAVVARLGDTYGTANVRTTTATTDGAGTAGLDALVATLAALGPDADTVTVALDGGRITVAGGVTSQATKAAALTAARTAVTKPSDVVDRLTLGTGVASPKQVATQLDSIPPVTYGATATAPNAVGRSMLSAVGFVLSLRSRATVTLEGHSDVSGDAALDLRRSLDRARSAEAYLVGQGLPGARILTTGLGSQNPAVAGDSAQADAANRRLVVRGGS